MVTAYFTASGGGYDPTPYAQSHWGDDHLNGPAMVGLAALAQRTLAPSSTISTTW